MKVNRSRVPEQCAFDLMCGANLHYIRKFRKLTLIKVSKQIPFTFQQLQKYEKGVNTISAYKLDKLCKIYGTAIDKIVRADFIHLHQNVKKYDQQLDYLSKPDPTLTPEQQSVNEELLKLEQMDIMKGRYIDRFAGNDDHLVKDKS